MDQQYPIRKKFLEEFVKEILHEIQRREHLISVKTEEIHMPKFEPKSIQLPQPIKSTIQPQIQKTIPPRASPPIMQKRTIFPKQIQRQPLPAPIKNIPAPSGTLADFEAMSAAKKLIPLLNDRFVQSIECKGAGQPILAITRGMPRVTHITLSGEEIKELMDEISRKVRIPLVTGLFKAAFGNVIITAVISEFVGTRFIIEKRV